MIAALNTGRREDAEVQESGCETGSGLPAASRAAPVGAAPLPPIFANSCSQSAEDERFSHDLLAQIRLGFRRSPVLMCRSICHC